MKYATKDQINTILNRFTPECRTLKDIQVLMSPDKYKKLEPELLELHIGELLVFKELLLFGQGFSNNNIELAKAVFTLSKYTPLSSEDIIRYIVEMPSKCINPSEAAFHIKRATSQNKL